MEIAIAGNHVFSPASYRIYNARPGIVRQVELSGTGLLLVL
jgi:hypothetical protein